jgi:hypothetical protein
MPVSAKALRLVGIDITFGLVIEVEAECGTRFRIAQEDEPDSCCESYKERAARKGANLTLEPCSECGKTWKWDSSKGRWMVISHEEWDAAWNKFVGDMGD